MSASAHHPLDADLLDLVEGALTPEAISAVEAHLAACVLCRIKYQRLSGEPLTDGDLNDVDRAHTDLGPIDLDKAGIPRFRPVDSVDASPETAAPGELWLTAGDEAVMVLLRQILDPSLSLVSPVTFDVEAADDGTVVLDADASPLGLPLAIHDGTTVRLPLDVLHSRVVPARTVDLLTVTVGDPGVRRGGPLDGPADPRHEVRQHLADRLLALSPGFGPVQDQLEDLRHGGATVEELATPAGCPDGWLGLARILERHLSILVVGTPAGLITESDYVAARGVAVRWHASALVVCAPGDGTVDLYTPKGLYDAMQVPLGHRAPEPTVSGLDLIDTVRKFLDLHPLWHVPAASETRPVPSVDVSELLDRNGRVATADLADRRVRGTDKRTAYQQAATRSDELAAILQRALAGTLTPEDIQGVAGGEPG